MQAWFISDIHLRDINERNSVILLRFLHSLLKDSKATHLFLLGDIFDLWVGNSDVFQIKFQAIVDALADLKQKGLEIHYFEGNHDVQVQGFWEKKLNIPVHKAHQLLELGPFQVRMEHGDYINPDDKMYLRYLELIRQPQMEKIANFIPGKFWDEVGLFASRKSRKKSAGHRRDSAEDMRRKIRKYAQDKFEETPFDFLITGHMHVRDEFEFVTGDRKAVSINLGSWFERPQALLLSEQGFSWREL